MSRTNRVAPVRLAVAAASVLALCGVALGQAEAPPPAQDQSEAQPPADGEPAAAPTIQFDRLDHEFGRILDTESVETEFHFTNTGNAPLQILGKPHASCGCTVPELAKTEYAPGESGTIKVIFNPQGKHGDQQTQIVVRTNDPLAPQVILRVRSHVTSLVRLEPQQAMFAEVLEGHGASRIVKVSGEAADFEATYVTVSRPHVFGVRLLGTKESQTAQGHTERYTELEVTVSPDLPRGRYQGIATIRTNDERVPLVSLQITADVVGDLRLLPPRMNVGVNEPGQVFQRFFRVTSRTNTPFRILGVDQESNLDSDLTFELTPRLPQGEEASDDTAAASWEVRLSGNAPQRPGPIRGKLVVRTDSPSDPQIELALSGACRPPLTRPAPSASPAHPAAPSGQPAQGEPTPAPEPAEAPKH